MLNLLPLLSARTAVHLFYTIGYVQNAVITAGNRLLKKQLRNNPVLQDHSPITFSHLTKF